MRFWPVALFVFCFGAVISQPVFTAYYYQWMLAHGAYRWNADSIAIPIGGNFISWLLWAPVLTVVFWFAFWRISAAPRLLAWAPTARTKSLLISITCFACVYLVGEGVAEAMVWRNWVEIVYSVWWIIIWLIVRAAFLTSRVPNKALEPTPTAVTSPAAQEPRQP